MNVLEVSEEELEQLKKLTEEFKITTESLVRWIRISHAALRLRCESPSWARENAALQTRRDTCFSQAVTMHYLIFYFIVWPLLFILFIAKFCVLLKAIY